MNTDYSTTGRNNGKEAISREFRVALPWELLYADDLAVIAETEKELFKRLNEWKDNEESKGMRVNSQYE